MATQAPTPRELDAYRDQLKRRLDPSRVGLAVYRARAEGLEASLEGFYKWLDDLVVARADESSLIGARFDASWAASAFFSSDSSTNGPFQMERAMG